MSDQINEAVSALLDDAANELDVRRVLKHAQQSDSVAATARRYQLVSSALQSDEKVGSSDALLGIDLSTSISAAIEHEQFEVADVETGANEPEPASVVSAENSGSAAAVAANDQSWMKQLGGLAVAASVAAIVVVGSQVLEQADPQSGLPELASTMPGAEQAMARQRIAAPPVVQPQRVNEGAEAAQLVAAEREARRELMLRQIEGYMQVHARHVSMNGLQGALPLARTADYK